MSIDVSALSLLPGTTNSASANILAILQNKGAATSGNPITALTTALSQEAKSVALVAKQPVTQQDIAAFRAAVAKAKTPAELFANPQARKVLLTANGLGDQAQFGALATKALLSDTSKTGSLASKLADPRWLSVAKTYDFANQGLAVLKKAGVIDTIANGYAEVQWRQTLDSSTPGLSNAIDFRSRASTITSVDQILGDSTLRKVVTTALGIPEQFAIQPLPTQEAAIASRIDISKFKNKAFVEQFTRRYLVAAGAAASDGGISTASGSASLLA